MYKGELRRARWLSASDPPPTSGCLPQAKTWHDASEAPTQDVSDGAARVQPYVRAIARALEDAAKSGT